MKPPAAIGLALAMLATWSPPAPASDIAPAVAWLNRHYEAQKNGACAWQPCPVAAGWEIQSITAGATTIDITFETPRPALVENIEAYQKLDDVALRMEQAFCPHGGEELYKLAPPPIRIRVHIADKAYGLVATAICSRRVFY